MLKVFAIVILSTILVVLIQAIVWRFSWWQPSLRTLLVILIFSPIAVFLAIRILIPPLIFFSYLDGGFAIFYYTAISLCYLITYTGIENDSPTLSLLLHLNRHPGMNKEDLSSFLNKHDVVTKRLDSMIQSGFLIQKNETLQLPKKPFLVFRIILWYRKSVLRISAFGG